MAYIPTESCVARVANLTANASVPNSIPAYTVADDGEITYATFKHVADDGEITYFNDRWAAVDHCATGGKAYAALSRSPHTEADWLFFCRH